MCIIYDLSKLYINYVTKLNDGRKQVIKGNVGDDRWDNNTSTYNAKHI